MPIAIVFSCLVQFIRCLSVNRTAGGRVSEEGEGTDGVHVWMQPLLIEAGLGKEAQLTFSCKRVGCHLSGTKVFHSRGPLPKVSFPWNMKIHPELQQSIPVLRGFLLHEFCYDVCHLRE